jgi:NADPH:quinone reductase-like Zn-dependent oxidoreductase
MSTRAIVVDPDAPGRYAIREFDDPQPLPNQAIVRVNAISLNRGEVRYSMTAPAGRRPGWDVAGVVEQPAADGTGPKAGARVAGLMWVGAWAQRVAVPTNQLGEIPDAVSFAQASTLPVAGLTALHALYKGGFLVGKTVLVTGATGGTGEYAAQLAMLGGARVVALSRSTQREGFLRELGAHEVVCGDDPSPAAQFGPYALIIDSVGGPHFGKVLAMLASKGVCVIFGTTAGAEPQINASRFYSTGSTTLYGMMLFHEIAAVEPASVGLRKLAELMAAGKLRTTISIEEPWTKVADVAQRLTDRRFVGKAVLRVD